MKLDINYSPCEVENGFISVKISLRNGYLATYSKDVKNVQDAEKFYNETIKDLKNKGVAGKVSPFFKKTGRAFKGFEEFSGKVRYVDLDV